MSSFANSFFIQTTPPSLRNLFLNRNKDNRGRTIRQPPAQTPEGRAVQSGNISSLVDQQVLGTQKAQAEAIADRDRAAQILQEFLQQNNPLANQISSSIQSGLQNPDVLSDEDIARLEARFNSIRARGLQDQINQASIDFAGRGIAGSGLQAAQIRNLNEQALQDVLRNISDLAVQRNALRNQNLNALRALGSQFSTAQRQQDQDATSLLAQILANTQRQAPDLSGFASLIADQKQAEFDNLIQASLVDLLQAQQNQPIRFDFGPVFRSESKAETQGDNNQAVLEGFLNKILSGGG